MRYLDIPGTGLTVSSLCFGGGVLSYEDYSGQCFELLDLFYAAGGTFFDTANVYGKHFLPNINTSEIMLGRWLRARRLRNKVVVATKGGHPDPVNSPDTMRLHGAEIASDLEESLWALQCDSIDFYWLHRDDENIPAGEIIEYMNEFRKQGKIRYFGVSNWKLPRILAGNAYAAEHGLEPIRGSQLLWNCGRLSPAHVDWRHCAAMDADMKKMHETTGMVALAYEAQARGFFTKMATGGDENSLGQMAREHYLTPENFEILERLKLLSKELRLTVSQLVLGYFTGQKFAAIPIPGGRRAEQLKDSLTAADLQLSEADIRFIDTGER